MARSADPVIAEIEAAFSGVVLGDGVGLREGQGLDDYQPREALVSIREKDEHLDWRRIPPTELRSCESSLSFFDAEGMRFHLPAFLISDLRGQSSLGPLYSLLHGFTDDDMDVVVHVAEVWRAPGEPNRTWFEHGTARFSAFTEVQVVAVVSYLTFKAEEDEYERERIEQALANYWRRRAVAVR